MISPFARTACLALLIAGVLPMDVAGQPAAPAAQRAISPLRVVPESTGPFVDARITFEHGEWFLRAELNPEGQLSGWYYGRTLPARVELVPLGGAEFLVDGFRWDEPDLRLRFTGDTIVIDDPAGPVTAVRQER